MMIRRRVSMEIDDLLAVSRRAVPAERSHHLDRFPANRPTAVWTSGVSGDAVASAADRRRRATASPLDEYEDRNSSSMTRVN